MILHISFSFLLFFCTLAHHAKADEVHDLLIKEIARQKSLELVVVNVKEPYTQHSIDNVEVISALINENNTFSAMMNSTQGEFMLNGSYAEAIQVPTLQQPVTSGTLITADMLQSSLVSINQSKSNVFLKQEDIVGKIAKRRIIANKLLKINDFESQKLIKKGNGVTIRFQGQGLLIETAGIALEAGGESQKIRIRAIDGSKILYGTVINPDLVEVNSK